MALVTRILFVASLALAVHAAGFGLEQNVKISPKSKGVEVSSKDAESIIKSAVDKTGVHFGTNDKITLSKSPEKVSGVTIEDIADIGKQHVVQKPFHINSGALKTLSSIKSPLLSKDKIVDVKKSKEIKFIINNKKTTNFEVSTIKNEIFGRGNIRLQGNGQESYLPAGETDRYIRKKESVSAVFSDKDNVPMINLNVHNLNAPNEGLIYVNNREPTSLKTEGKPNYILVNVSGEPALIPSVLLGKTGLIPKDNTINNTNTVSELPFFDFWPKEQGKIPDKNILPDNNALLKQFKSNKTHPEMLKERLKHIEAFLKEGLSIPKLNDGSFDWEKITSHVIKEQPKLILTTARPEVTTRKVSVVDIRKQLLLPQLEKLGIRIPKHLDGSVDWNQIGVILKKVEHDSSTTSPIIVTKKPIVITTKKPDILDSHKEYLIEKHAELGLPIPKNPDGSINWDLVVKHLINSEVTSKRPEIITTTKKPDALDFEKQLLLAKLTKTGLPIPKRPDGSVEWNKVIAQLKYIGTGNVIDVTTRPPLSREEQEINALYTKLGLRLPKKPNGDIDWDAAYKYLVTLQKETKKPIDNEHLKEEKEKLNIIQQLTNLGIKIPKLPNGGIDWQSVKLILENGGTTEAPTTTAPNTESRKGVIVLGKTNLLSTFKRLGLPIPTKPDGTEDWDSIIKYLIEHGYKIETGEITGKGFGIGDLINMSLGDRLGLLQQLQNLGLPIPRLPNGQVDWRSIYSYLLSNGYKMNGNGGGFNLNNLGMKDRLNLLEKMKNSGVAIPKLPNGNLDWVAISKYFANDDGSLNLKLINRMTVQDRVKLLNQVKSLGIPLYTLPNGQYDWGRILQAVRDKGYKLTGTVITLHTGDVASRLSADDRMQLLREITRLRLPVPRLPGGGIDWNGIVAELGRAKTGSGWQPSRPSLTGILGNLLG